MVRIVQIGEGSSSATAYGIDRMVSRRVGVGVQGPGLSILYILYNYIYIYIYALWVVVSL